MAPGQRSQGCFYTVVAVILGICLIFGVFWFVYLSPNHAHSPFFDRHGLPSTMPLPDNVSFNFAQDVPVSTGLFSPSILFHQSVWLAQGQNATSVQQFYQQALSNSGWSSIHQASDGTATGQRLSGCQGDQVLLVYFSDTARQLRNGRGDIVDVVEPPPGGSILQLIYATVDDAQLRAGACNS